MKILIGADTYYPNIDGASYFTQRLASHLKKRGHSVLVVAQSPTWHTHFFSHDGVDIFGLYSVPTFFHKDYRFSPPFFIKRKIKEVIQTFNPDIVHIQGHFFIEQTVAEVARELHIPVLGTNHFMPENLVHYLHLPKRPEDWLKKMAWKQFCGVFNKLETITTPTKTGAQVLKNIGFKKPVKAISCGIDLKKFNPNNNGDYLRERYHIPNKPILLHVGRLAPEKNIDLVLRALARDKKVHPHFVIVGNGMERDRLERMAYSLGIHDSVTFTEFIPDADLPNIYSLATAFVSAGDIELQSLTTMEAMASGLPVIAINALALPELVHDGVNGFLFKRGDEHGLSEAIRKIFQNKTLRNSMAQKSLEIIQKHDIEKTIDQFEELYKAVEM